MAPEKPFKPRNSPGFFNNSYGENHETKQSRSLGWSRNNPTKDDDNPDLFQAYLDQFPDGAYTSIAKIKINELRGDSQSSNKSSLTERLKTLKQLFESELISSEDYEAKKAELLKEL